MTTVESRERSGWLCYWRLPRADRRTVRRIETTCRALGDRHLDGIALARLRRAARRERILGPVLRLRERRGLTAADRVARLCSTMRHPSRTGCPSTSRRSSGVPATRPRTS